jgi:DNA repair exonuclease SbcCD nuclease subunit
MIKIVTDPHEGLKRASHTTPSSKLRWTEEIHRHLMKQLDTDHSVYCLGDLFDKSNNPESVIIKGYEAVGKMKRVVSGNHDLINRADVITSMQLLHDELGLSEVISFSPFGQYTVDIWEEQGWTFFCIPHASTQTLFEKALQEAYDKAEMNNRDRNVLLLHCNYDIPTDFATDTSLNLTKENAQDLSEKFRVTVLGHEHNPKEDLNGSVVVLGSTMPTDFSCMGEKRAMLLSETGEISYETIWESSLQAEIDAKSLLKLEVESLAGKRFISVTGNLKQSEVSDFNKALRSLWDNDTILAIKASPNIEGSTLSKFEASPRVTNLATTIAEQLKKEKDQRLFAMFQEVYKEIRSDNG